ncbi:hypothetical protein MKP08_00515 [Erythrobacter sp. LQ02-29]|uniref:hypothetical protein n=1 Tax=Erythrobacter sp. LQ02-29 TaxID=2920384 RepID=UPI001F4DC787|nr:hypothetical protein [Erythrobacter sp. LQ02-29]MCP9221232.1 hypothetical protein [Erythrobacter sp. LQ02-29]
MIPRLTSGWQIMLADLSLILFIVTAAAIDTDAAPTPAQGLAARAEPVAVFRPTGETDLTSWLAERPTDPREQLTIVARYGAGGLDRTRAQAEALARQADAAGLAPRIVIEPGEADDVAAVFAFDPAVARNLQRSGTPAQGR